MKQLTIVFPYHLKSKLKKQGNVWKGQILVSPRMAKEWLKKNTNNRPVKKKWVKILANAITTKKFLYNGDTIRFDTDGNVLDGQHRLLAIIKAERGVYLDIIVGLDANTYSTMDQNVKRTATDIAKTTGFYHYRVAGSAVKSILGIYKKDYKRSMNPFIPSYEVDDFFLNNPKYDDVCGVAQEIGKKSKLVSKAWIATFLWVFSDYDWDKAETFVTKVALGVDVKDGSPIWKLRNFIETVKLSPSLNMNRGALRALTIKTWNAYLTNTNYKKLKFDPNETVFIEGIDNKKPV